MGDIEAIARRYIEAVRNKDEEAFLALYDEDAIVFDLWDRWSYVGREAWGASVAAWFGSLGDEQVQVDFEPVSSVVTGDWAVWCAFTRYSALDRSGTVLRSMQNRLSWSLRRTENRWLIVHEHTSAPADHQSLTVSLTRDGVSGRTS